MQADFDALNDRMNKAFGYPDGKGTRTYAEPIKHPDGLSISMVIEDRCLKVLKPSEISALVDQTATLNQWWYSKITIDSQIGVAQSLQKPIPIVKSFGATAIQTVVRHKWKVAASITAAAGAAAAAHFLFGLM
jgi:hypothetical protein